MPRKPNVFYEAAVAITDLMQPDARLYNSTHAMNMKHLSMLCGKKAKASGETVYEVEDVVEAFKALKQEMDALGYGCNLLTLLKGAPKRHIDRLLELPEMPPVWDSSAHDAFVRKYAKRLSKAHWHYSWATPEQQIDESRLTYQEAQELGLVEE